MRKIFALKLITFLSAFLLFQIELIISKRLLPDFGGSYLVWGSCVVFFQAMLLLGYFCSYLMLRKINPQKLLPLYLGLFILPLLCFPGRSFPQVAPANLSIPLVANVFGHLLLTIGPVFFVLSTVSVMLQAWLADSDLEERSNPYALYAVSNLGSLAALVTYPFLFELFLDIGMQFLLWRILYFSLLGLIIHAVFTVKVNRESKINKIWNMNGVLRQDYFRWLLYSAASVIMFLSVTNMITYEVAPIPLLWVVPLCIYLVSFVLNFKQRPWSPSWVVDKFYLTFAWSVVWFFMILSGFFPFIVELIVLCLFLFHICMFCQHQLHKTKPTNLDNLPLFYLIIASGGFLGGLVATWVMPLISVSICEYLLGLLLIALALAVGTKPVLMGWRNVFLVSYVCIMLVIWPVFFRGYNIFGVIIIFLTFRICFTGLFKYPRSLFFSILMILLITPLVESMWTNTQDIYRHRNYYGLYRVFLSDGKYILMHGSTIHGVQFQDKKKENQALAYYHKLTPIGELLTSPAAENFKNIGVIGLGSGGLAAYGRAGTEIDYFEIDPDVYPIAKNLFTFVKHTKAKVNIIYGDARITIKKMPAKRYDLLIVDAFSGDAIPVHLLTTEAINEYRKHLTDKGMILFHVSNRYLDFVPVLLSNANYLDAYANAKRNSDDSSQELFATTWFAMSWDINTFNLLVNELGWAKHTLGKRGFIRAWTDEYSNMILIIRLKGMLSSLQHFQPFRW